MKGTDQSVTLIHELLHVHLQRGDIAVARLVSGYSGSKQDEASTALNAWVKDFIR
jgi:hypothetical protein